MKKLIETYLLPHPPIILPEIGKGEERTSHNTVEAMKNIAQRVELLQPDTIIVITPHGPIFEDAICISVEEKLNGSFKNFGYPSIAYEFENNQTLAQKIINKVLALDIPVGELDREFAKRYHISAEIDHGTLVPLYYINKKYNTYRLVHISIGLLPYDDLYRIGMAITDAVLESYESVVVIASGDLSHRLTASAPAGYDVRGEEFDRILIDKIRHADIEGILDIQPDLIQCAGECGYRPLVMMLGTLDGWAITTEVLSYEGPFGVGYAVVRFETGKEEPSRKLYEKLTGKQLAYIEGLRENEDSYIALARTSLEHYVKQHNVIRPPEELPPEMKNKRAGVFVSIKKHGQLRGCIGTTSPSRPNIAQEIIHNAISAGTRDPRFPPIEVNELDKLVYSVDILKEPEPIKSIDELDVYKYGVIVSDGRRTGLLLPNLEGVDTPEEQVSIALKKAGIKPDEAYEMQRFEVIRYK